MPRPKDGVKSKFNNVVMPEIRKLVPDFEDGETARQWYRKLMNYAWFDRRASTRGTSGPLPDSVFYVMRSHWCTDQVQRRLDDIELSPNEHNPMEVLHILAHYFQPAESAWHGGEFSQTFLDLIERSFSNGTELRRQARQILLDNKIKTYKKELTDEQREAASNRFKTRRSQPLIDEMKSMIRKKEPNV